MEKWDKFRKNEVRITRTTLIISAVEFYINFLRGNFNDNSKISNYEINKKIDILVKTLQSEKSTVQNDLIAKFDKIAEYEIPYTIEIKDKVKNCIKKIPQNTNTIAQLLNMDRTIIYIILSKMRKEKFVILNKERKWEICK